MRNFQYQIEDIYFTSTDPGRGGGAGKVLIVHIGDIFFANIDLLPDHREPHIFDVFNALLKRKNL